MDLMGDPPGGGHFSWQPWPAGGRGLVESRMAVAGGRGGGAGPAARRTPGRGGAPETHRPGSDPTGAPCESPDRVTHNTALVGEPMSRWLVPAGVCAEEQRMFL